MALAQRKACVSWATRTMPVASQTRNQNSMPFIRDLAVRKRANKGGEKLAWTQSTGPDLLCDLGWLVTRDARRIRHRLISKGLVN
jgi:hypothetical protein